MARIAGKDANFSFNSVPLEDELNSIDLSIDNDVIEVTAFADAAETYVEGKYGSKISISGHLDPAASQGDATLFAAIGAGELAVVFDPTGIGPDTAAPTYNGNALVKSYKIKADIRGSVSYSADLQISGALTRDVTS